MLPEHGALRAHQSLGEVFREIATELARAVACGSQKKSLAGHKK